jgi:hypothetical protein
VKNSAINKPMQPADFVEQRTKTMQFQAVRWLKLSNKLELSGSMI